MVPLIMQKPSVARVIAVSDERVEFTHLMLHGSSRIGLDPDWYVIRKPTDIDGRHHLLEVRSISESLQNEANPYIRNADGIILLYDISSRESFDFVTMKAYKYACKVHAAKFSPPNDDILGPSRFGCVLVGADCFGPDKREVSSSLGKAWADAHGIEWFESIDAKAIDVVAEPLMRSIINAKRRNREELKERLRLRKGGQVQQEGSFLKDLLRKLNPMK